MAHAYDLSSPSRGRLATIAESWRPYRSWVSVLFRAHRETTTGEIIGGASGRRPG
jgi:3-methyladenine DNA glycosylase/8-oxoguanine DNA glycosylase